MNETVVNLIVVIIQILTFAILARSILTWFPMNPNNPVITVLWHITEPILSPLRRIIPRVGMIDITPMVAIILLYVISAVLARSV